jgi:spore maturation protein CgeB
LRVLLVHPGATWSTADVEDGLRHGLESHGVQVLRYRLDTRLERASSWLFSAWRRARKTHPDLPKPTTADAVYQAGIGALEMALRQQVDVVLVVSAMLLHPDVIILMKRAGLRVAVLFTESPYDAERERRIAALVDGCWTNERSSVTDFRRVTRRVAYLPHAWHPVKHRPDAPLEDVPAHDVVFVGSGFAERAKFFNAIDWTGIDLGLYGAWNGTRLNRALQRCLRERQIDNRRAAALYRRAKIGLNLYRVTTGFNGPPISTPAESLNPRAYELAACGVFTISEFRSEVADIFGTLVPTFRTPIEAAALLRTWLADDAGRAAIAAQLPGRVAESSWAHRAACVIGDLTALLPSSAVAVSA